MCRECCRIPPGSADGTLVATANGMLEVQPQPLPVCRPIPTWADEELLAAALGHPSPMVAADLLRRCSGLPGLARRAGTQVEALDGVALGRLGAVLELGRRLVERRPLRGEAFHSGSSLVPSLEPLLCHRRDPPWVLVVYDQDLRLRARHTLPSPARPCRLPLRAIVRLLFDEDAAAFVVAHAHPAGDPTPNARDVDGTLSLQATTAPLGFELLDHVVLGAAGDWRSLRDLGAFLPQSAAPLDDREG
jgi:DNA repair protein RadC